MADIKLVTEEQLGDYITEEDISDVVRDSDISNVVRTGDLSSVATSGNYSDLNGTPSIPGNVSQLTNDSGFITGSFDGSDSGIEATTIQGAINELKALIDALSTED